MEADGWSSLPGRLNGEPLAGNQILRRWWSSTARSQPRRGTVAVTRKTDGYRFSTQ
jgi:hypothetical protein